MSDPNQPEKAIVTVHSARELYETNFISKMDPYCICELGGQEYKTNVDSNGSTTPKWDQTFTFSYVGETTMRFKVMDKDKFTSDDYVGLADVSLGPIIHGTRKYATELQLTRKEGKQAGYLKVTIEFFPKKKEEEKPAAAPAAAPAPAAPAPYGAPPAYQGYPNPNPYGYAAPAPAPYAPSPYGYAAPAPAPGYGAYQQAPPYGAAYPGYAPNAPAQKKKKKKSKKKKSSSSSSSSDSD